MESEDGDVSSSANIIDTLGTESMLKGESESVRDDGNTSGFVPNDRTSSAQDIMAQRLKEMKERLRIQMENADWQGAKTTESEAQPSSSRIRHNPLDETDDIVIDMMKLSEVHSRPQTDRINENNNSRNTYGKTDAVQPHQYVNGESPSQPS